MKKVLILGGTLFIGRAFVEELLKSKEDYDITIFNRGKSNIDIFPEIRRIKGDRRTDDVAQLGKENWDIVIDFCSYYPLPLQKLVDTLKGKVGRYIYISTGSVYDMEQTLNTVLTEDSPLLSYTDADKTDTTMETYGKRKKACEDVLLADKSLDTIILRPSIVYGKYDYTDRHYYWLYHLQHQKQVILPKGDHLKMAFTFVDDLAKAAVQSMTIPKHNTIYNISTHPMVDLKTLVQTMADALQKEVVLLDTSAEFLAEQGVKEYKDILYWVADNYFMLNSDKIINDFGIQFDSLTESMEKTVAYYKGINWPVCKAGISLERENELIEKMNVLT